MLLRAFDSQGAMLSGCRLRAQVHHVYVNAEPRIVGEVPAGIVGIGIEDDVVGSPVPAVAVPHVSGGDGKVESAEPEARRTAATETPDLASAGGTREATVFPGMVEMIGLRVRRVAHPATVTAVDVRRGWVVGLIGLAAFRERGVSLRAVRRDVAATDGRTRGSDRFDGGVGTGTRVSGRGRMATLGMLCENWEGKQRECESCENCPGTAEVLGHGFLRGNREQGYTKQGAGSRVGAGG